MNDTSKCLHDPYVPFELAIWIVDAWHFDCIDSDLRQTHHLDVYCGAQQQVENTFKLLHIVSHIYLWFQGLLILLLPAFFVEVYAMVDVLRP